MRLPSFLHKFDLNRKTGMDRRTQMEHDVLLQMTDICKEFPGVKALDHVSLAVRRGTVHALMGENGEGTSKVTVPWYVLYAAIIVALMWFIWNKTTFGKNMFAVGSNPEAANVSGVNVMKTTIMVHTLAGMMYGITGFIESARIGSNTANTGLNYECDAIAACVIGGVSFVGGTGKISGVVMGVF